MIWDGLRNRLQQFDSGVLTQRSFNAANGQVLLTPASGAPTTQVFDANGNLALSTTGSAVTTNTWSPENRLLSQLSPTVNEQYLYGQDGLRRQKINSSGTTLYTIDSQNVLMETNTGGTLQARNTPNPSGHGGPISQSRSTASSFYGFDSQRSTRILVSFAGFVTDSYSFKAFGEELQTGSGTVNPYWYIGQDGYYRDLPGVMNVGHRKLIAANGTWLNRDLIGFAGGDVNLMRYAGDNPVVRVDPSGLECRNFVTSQDCYTDNFIMQKEGDVFVAGNGAYKFGETLNIPNYLCILQQGGHNLSLHFEVQGFMVLRVTFQCYTD
jgi:RHS repeat-associated protein